MPIRQLAADLRPDEEAELQRLEGAVTDAAGACGRSACAAAAGQFVEQRTPRPRATSKKRRWRSTQGDVTQARATLVTGYAEHRASLIEKKKYRRAIKINLKLPGASTALAGVPRRKDFAEGEEGRQA